MPKKRVANDIDKCHYQLHASGNSFDKLPPPSSALNQHTRRSIYQAEVWRSCLKRKQNLPSPLDWGWELTESGELKPIWTTEAPVTSVNVYTYVSLQLQVLLLISLCMQKYMYQMHRIMFL